MSACTGAARSVQQTSYPVAPTPVATPTPAPTTSTSSSPTTPTTAQDMSAIFDGVTQQTLGNCSPNILYYPGSQNGFSQYPGSWSGTPNWPTTSDNNTQTPALTFFNGNIANGYYQPIQYQPQSQWQYSHNGFYPSQYGGNCMNSIGQGTAQIGQLLPYYNPNDVANWAVQVFAYAYFQGMTYSSPQTINIYQNNTVWLYFP